MEAVEQDGLANGMWCMYMGMESALAEVGAVPCWTRWEELWLDRRRNE